MKRLALLFLLLSVAAAQDQPKKYWIRFTDKGTGALLKSAPAAEVARAAGITDRALARRAKMGTALITEEDLPVPAERLAALKDRGITVQNVSRWFNAASAFLTPEQTAIVAQLPFVRAVEPVRTFTGKELPRADLPEPSPFAKATVDPDSARYGPSLTHMKFINAVAVHHIGISGRGVLVGMLDTGFRWKTHEAMKDMTVIAEYDFIQKDNNTANEAGDATTQDSHGTGTMSLVGAYKEGKLVSPAFHSAFILGKTEYVPTETHVEEDNWAAAIEWMEAQGVDVVSSSLGYNTFDSGVNYSWADMNGRTAIVSKAAVLAARKGVVVVNAMGNEYHTAPQPTITAPADADSIISVGAMNIAGTVAGFSSNGPTSDGRMKPDVCAHGVGTYWAIPVSGTSTIYYSGSSQGTSLATPLVAGAAAMVLSAHPELTPIQVRDALRNTANNAATPDSLRGWGAINAYKAVLYNGLVISTDPVITRTPDSNYSVEMCVVSTSVVNKDSIRLYYSVNDGATFTALPMSLGAVIDSATNSGTYTAVIPQSATTPRFYVRAVDATAKPRTSPFAAPGELYSAATGTTGITPGTSVPAVFALQQNFPNPFNPSTNIRFSVPVSGIVTLNVYDVLGKQVATVVNGFLPYGNYTYPFTASGLSSGVYFYRLQTESFTQTRRMVLLR